MQSDYAVSGSGGLSIHLLGPPLIEVDGDRGYRFRSRKSWALLSFLLLAERPPTRSRLATLLFAEADDPLGALRWCLAELRRGLGSAAVLDGDPVRLTLPPGSAVDVDVLVHGHWNDAIRLPGLGLDLLDGLAIANAEPFEAWLLSQRRRLSAAAEAIVHEAAVGLLARGELERARDLAVQATEMSPLDENHQALLIRIYRLAGDEEAAARQFESWSGTAERELGTSPGAAVLLALRERRATTQAVDAASIRAVTEGGAAAVSAGALVAGVASFEAAVRMADQAGAESVRVETRLVLAEALIHTLGGLDEAGVATLTEAERIAISQGDLGAVARARAELGYVDFLRARYDRAERLLDQVLAARDASPSDRAKAMTYLGSVASDRAEYPRAITLLDGAVSASRAASEPRREAYGLSMLGRAGLLRGDLDAADQHLRAAVELAEREHWLSFLPWPQALLGHVQLAQGDLAGAAGCLEQSFARACQIGDPCWEGISARGLALLAEASGDAERAIADLLDARSRTNRLADPYVWLDVHILDALCEMGGRHGHPLTASWVEEMRERSSRAGMRELTVRAMLHGARRGDRGDAEAAALVAATIDNPMLAPLLAGLSEHPLPDRALLREGRRRFSVADSSRSVRRVSQSFLLTSFVICVTPGIGALYTLAAGLARGTRAGVLAAFACTLGTIPHAVAALTGLAAVLHASGVAFQAVKYAGVAYLLWLAWSTWRDTGALHVDTVASPTSVRSVITTGITANLLNPKLTLFFFAFLPQFVPTDSQGTLARMAGLSAVFMAMTFVVFALYAVAAGALRKHVLTRPRLVTRIRKVFAASFVALSARLAVESR